MPRKKTNQEFLNELQTSFGDEYTPLEDYKGNNKKIKILHKDCNETIEVRPKDILLKKSKCSVCSGNRKLTYSEMKLFIEQNSDCKLLSKDVSNTLDNIEIECSCGNPFITKFSLFKHENKRRCNDCSNESRKMKQMLTYEYVREVIESKSCILIESEYNGNHIPLNIICPNNHSFQKRFSDFNVNIPCPICSIKEKGIQSRLNIDLVKRNIEHNDGYTLIDEMFEGTKTKLNIKCPENHTFKMTYSDFYHNGQRCPICYANNRRANATSHIFSWLRTQVKDWKKFSMQKDNYKCVVTGKPMEVIHHLYSFNLIAKETMEALDLPVLENISEYTDEQIELMVAKCIELHNNYGLGVCLTKEVHRLFHSTYGFINDKEQFTEFVNRYKSGEFQEQLAV